MDDDLRSLLDVAGLLLRGVVVPNGMKRLMIIGGLLGFAIGMALGASTEGADAATMLWRACVAGVAGGFLLRWWGRVWVRCLREAHAQRLATDESTPPAAVPSPAKPSGTPRPKLV